jgi:lactoylglutathione lyase
MRIEHVALFTHDLEGLRAFYEAYLGGRAGKRYENPARLFTSYFLTFGTGPRLELMQMAGVPALPLDPGAPREGYVHLAFEVGKEAEVDALCARLLGDGHRVVGAPRRTGDGYYEGVVLDPDGNLLELVAGGAGPPRG